MKFMKKLLSTMTAAAIGLSMTTALSVGTSVASAADKTAVQMVENMGLGWNLGNALDSTNTWTSNPSPADIETAWGNVVATENMIKEVKKAGFNTVRIPVTWWDMTGASGTAKMDSFDGTVADQYLARVKEVVDYCVDNGMYAIINTHHDEDWEKDTSKIATFEKLWKQIATYFEGYDEHLVFEGMNEVSFSTSDAMTYNQAFVDTVRATGGNNKDRLLICTADSNNTAKALSGSFSMPKDDSNMLAVSVHYYEPPTFCVADTTSTWGHRETWGTAADLSKVEKDFNDLKTKFTDNGYGVVIGEYGACNADKYGVNTTPYNKDEESIKAFYQAIASTAYKMDGICPVAWDDSDSGTICLFSRKNMKWFDEDLKNIFSNIASGGNVDPGKQKTDRLTFQASDVADGSDLLPDASLSAARFSGNYCLLAMFDADTPLAAIDLSNPTKPALAEVSGLSELFNVLLPADGTLLNLSGAAQTNSMSLALSTMTLGGGSVAATGLVKELGAYAGGAVYAAVSQDAAWALVCYDHTSHLFRLGDAFTEVSRPEISVHSGTAFFFDGDYLYACAPDEVSAVSLTSGSVDALLSFAVG